MMIKINYIFARMNPDRPKTQQLKQEQPSQQGYFSDQSEQYQQLDLCPLSQLEMSIPPQQSSPQQQNNIKTYSSTSIQCELQKSLEQQIEQLRSSLNKQISAGVKLKKINDGLLAEFRPLHEHLAVKQAKCIEYEKESRSLKALNNKLQNEVNQLKQQILQKNKKISQFKTGFTAKLQQKKARELQIITILNKLFNKHLQTYDQRAVSLLIEEEFAVLGKLKTLLSQIGVTLNQKQFKGKDIVLQNQEKNKRFDFEEMLEKTKKIQLGIYRLQSQATAHREYCYKLEKQLESMRQNQGGTMKKWLDPVFKFCKIEEQPSTTEKRLKKKKTSQDHDFHP